MDRPNSIVDLRSIARSSTTPEATLFSAPFSQLLFTFRFCGATNPLDKIYALRGMVTPESSGADVPVEYQFSKEELYRKVARALRIKSLAKSRRMSCTRKRKPEMRSQRSREGKRPITMPTPRIPQTPRWCHTSTRMRVNRRNAKPSSLSLAAKD